MHYFHGTLEPMTDVPPSKGSAIGVERVGLVTASIIPQMLVIRFQDQVRAHVSPPSTKATDQVYDA